MDIVDKKKNAKTTESSAFLRGRILYTPPPPPLKIPFKGWGAYKKGGRIKSLPRGGSEYTPPPPSPEKYLLARNGGRGGGVYNFSLDFSCG